VGLEGRGRGHTRWRSAGEGVDVASPPGDAAEHRADGQPEPGQVSFPEDVASHHLAGGEDVPGRPAVLHDHPSALVDGDSEIGERDARSEWVGPEGRAVETLPKVSATILDEGDDPRSSTLAICLIVNDG
jgi:hypothetical protein